MKETDVWYPLWKVKLMELLTNIVHLKIVGTKQTTMFVIKILLIIICMGPTIVGTLCLIMRSHNVVYYEPNVYYSCALPVWMCTVLLLSLAAG